MASKLLKCSRCDEELTMESKILPCLHSFCCSCWGKQFKGDTDGNGQCPRCQKPVTLEQLSLSRFQFKSLKRKQLESKNWKCTLCLEDGIRSTAINWCHDCNKIHCANCSRIHHKLQKDFNQGHSIKDLGELIKVIMGDVCSSGRSANDSYCEQCNVCHCEACYKSYSGPTLAKEMDDFKISLRSLNERTRNYTDKLKSDCDSKCMQLWRESNEMIENIKRRTSELRIKMRQVTDEQVRRWRHLLEKNNKILKQLENWWLELENKSRQDVDVVCGLHSLRLKLPSQLQKSIGPEKKSQLELTLPDWWQPAFDQLKNNNFGSVSLTIEQLPPMNLIFDKQWNRCGSNSVITSIHVSRKDYHFFICDCYDPSIMEFTEEGDFVCKCILLSGTDEFKPFDICAIALDIFIVACNENKLLILQRREKPPFLQIQRIINTNNQIFSICRLNRSIFASDDNFQVDSITRDGKKIKTIKTGESPGSEFINRIHFDPSSGNFWGNELNSTELFCFDPNGKKIRSVRTVEKISDFCMNEFGDLYFCNWEGIFSFSTKKTLYKFERKSERVPRIFVLRNKMFVCLRIDGKDLIKIFKIFY